MNNLKLCLIMLAGFTLIILYFHLYTEHSLKYSYVQSVKIPDTNNNNNKIVVYNRVPKTGSTSLMNVAYELHNKNRFRVVQVRLIGSKHLLSVQDQMSIATNISAWNSLPLLLHGHFSYLDPQVLGVQTRPVYINLIREPLERLVSYYYFLRYGDDVLDKVRSKQGDTTTFDECVAQSQPDCDPKKLWMQIPFFCGSSPNCWDPGSAWALDQAKHNLVNKYLVVGVTEDFESFVEVLEVLLPQFFHGAEQYLRDTGKAHIKRTKHKDAISASTADQLKKTTVYRMEAEFYAFAAAHFAWVKKTVSQQKQQQRPLYVYEKVRPK